MARYALVVGINYENNNAVDSLEFAVKDASRIHHFLSFGGYESKLMTDSHASQSEINEELSLIKRKLNPGDTFLFYFSGHGTQTPTHQYILPYDGLPVGVDGSEKKSYFIKKYQGSY